MITTSEAFTNTIVANGVQDAALVEFEILDVTAAGDATVTVTAENSFSEKDQTVDGERFMSAKYATFETDYWDLGGSFSIPPSTSGTGIQAGWWSDDLSGSGGTFSTPQVHTTTFTLDHDSIGITVTFDTLTDEYALDFTIQVYDSLDGLIDSISVTSNTLAKYVWDNELEDYRKVVITITKWRVADRRARIVEVDFGIVQEYNGDDLINLSILEEIDTLNNKLTSNEVRFTIENLDKDFNILNPTGIYAYLQRQQKVIPYLGVYTGATPEFVKMGVYYLKDWISSEGTIDAVFIARDLLDTLVQSTFPETAYTTKTLEFIIDDIMDDAGVTSYNVDSALASITVTGTLPESSHRVALQTAAIAGQAAVYQDRDGVIQIEQLTTPASVFSITYDHIYKAPKIKLNKLINTVNVTYGASTHIEVDSAKPASEATLEVTIDNPLISTQAHAEDVAEWVLAEVKKRFIYDISWRHQPALEPGDMVVVEDEYEVDKIVRILQNDITFNGAMTSRTKLKGGT